MENHAKKCMYCEKELNKNYTLRKDLVVTGNPYLDDYELIVYIRSKTKPVFIRFCEKCTRDKLLWFITEV